MVMPRSRSSSLESMTRSAMCWCAANVPDWCSNLSTSVVLPWSTWAMIARLRMERDIQAGCEKESRIVSVCAVQQRKRVTPTAPDRAPPPAARAWAVSPPGRFSRRAPAGRRCTPDRWRRRVSGSGSRREAVSAEFLGEREQVVRLRRAGEHGSVDLRAIERVDQPRERSAVLRERPAVGGYFHDFRALRAQRFFQLHVALAVTLDDDAFALERQVLERSQHFDGRVGFLGAAIDAHFARAKRARRLGSARDHHAVRQQAEKVRRQP